MNDNMKLMLNEKPLKMLFKLGVPAILIALFDEINGVIDTIFLGQHVASEAVSAMSVAIPFLLIISAISLLFTEGAGIAISRYLGGNNYEQANRVFNNTLFISVFLSVVIGLLSFMFMEDILKLFQLDPITYNYALQYLEVIALAMPFVVLAMVLSKMIYTEGYTIVLIKVTFIQIISNVMLNYIALAILKIGIRGAGLATMLSFIIQVGLMIRFIRTDKMLIKLNYKDFKLSINYFKEIVPLGMATFVTVLLLSFTFGLESKVMAVFGDKALAVQTITGNLFSVTSSITSGIMSSALILMSYSVGAKNYKRFTELIKISAILVFSISILVNLPVVIKPELIGKIFTDNAQLIEIFIVPAVLYALASPFIFTTNVVLYAMQPVGMANTSTTLFFLQQIVFFAPLLFLLRNFGFDYAILAQPIAEIVGGLITLILIPVFFRKIKKAFEISDDGMALSK